MSEYPRFSDFAEEENPLEGEKKKLDEILNMEILVTGFKVGKSKYKDKDYLTLQFENGDGKCIVFTGSVVLTKQAQKYEDMMPFYTTVKKVNNYYTLT